MYAIANISAVSASITFATSTVTFKVSLDILEFFKKLGWQSAPPTKNGRRFGPV
jgi:hypothetical protein